MQNQKEKDSVLIIYLSLSTFTKRDILILSSKFNVKSFHFNTIRKYFLPFAFLKQFLFLVFNFHKYKSIIIQSSGYLSFLPVIFGKIFNKKVVIIAIGTDCAKLPEINYGAHIRQPLSWFTNFSFKHATLILPVHKSLEENKYIYKKVKYQNQGIRSFNPKIKTKIVEVINGYNTEKWIINGKERIKNSFLTVTLAINKIGYYRKGIDLIIALAKAYPKYKFTIVGKVYMDETIPENVLLIDNLTQNKLLDIYNQHEYYLQLSMFEGFPNALCEAMLCGCIPIGSNVAGIPEIIGNSGYILQRKDFDLLKKIFIDLKYNRFTHEEVRNRIVFNFPLQKRKDLLLHQI